MYVLLLLNTYIIYISNESAQLIKYAVGYYIKSLMLGAFFQNFKANRSENCENCNSYVNLVS